MNNCNPCGPFGFLQPFIRRNHKHTNALIPANEIPASEHDSPLQNARQTTATPRILRSHSLTGNSQTGEMRQPTSSSSIFRERSRSEPIPIRRHAEQDTQDAAAAEVARLRERYDSATWTVYLRITNYRSSHPYYTPAILNQQPPTADAPNQTNAETDHEEQQQDQNLLGFFGSPDFDETDFDAATPQR